MGGLVARSVFLHPQFNYNSVDLVLTLSTPHNTAPFAFDWHIQSFYRLRKLYSKSAVSLVVILVAILVVILEVILCKVILAVI